MSPKLIGALAVITLITTVAAVVVAIEQPRTAPLRLDGEPAFPDLREQPDAVTKAVIRTPEDQITLVREAPDRWVTPERHGYPVATDRVRALIVELADMRLIEAKTSRPHRLEVQDLEAEVAKSTLVRLENRDGEVLAEALFGKQRQRLTGMQSSGIYLRQPGKDRSWLASGGLRLQARVQDWLQTTIVDLKSEDIRRIAVRPGDGEAYVAAREREGAPLALQNLAEDERAKEDAGLDQLAGAFGGLELEDVKPADRVAWPEATSGVEIETFDGLQLEARLAMVGDQPWLAIERASGPRDEAVAAAEEPAEAETANSEQGTPGQAQAAEGPEAGSQGKTSGQQAPPDAQVIAERTQGWAYRISKPVYERLTSRARRGCRSRKRPPERHDAAAAYHTMTTVSPARSL